MSSPRYRERSRSPRSGEISPSEIMRRREAERGMSPEELKASRLPRGMDSLFSRLSMVEVEKPSRRSSRRVDRASVMDIDLQERTAARERQQKIKEEKERKAKEEAEAREARAKAAKELRESRKQTKKGVEDIISMFSAVNVEPTKSTSKGGKPRKHTKKTTSSKK